MWAVYWQMESNPDKCEVRYFERSNMKIDCKLQDFRNTDVWRNLKVQVHRSPKVARQVDWVVRKMYNIFAFIGQGIQYKS